MAGSLRVKFIIVTDLCSEFLFGPTMTTFAVSVAMIVITASAYGSQIFRLLILLVQELLGGRFLEYVVIAHTPRWRQMERCAHPLK